jgi:hypothetical protein
MLNKTIFSAALVLALAACGGESVSTSVPTDMRDVAQVGLPGLDAATSAKLTTLLALRKQNGSASIGEIIDVLSGEFIGTPYKGDVLVGSATVPEQLVVDFSGLDCFTYLDYVEAVRRTSGTENFVSSLISTRYVDGRIGFTTRRHFFTDWADRTSVLADDITATLSDRAIAVDKQLNLRADGGAYLPGLPVRARTMVYIPSAYVDEPVVAQLRTGDFIGIYAKADGLDVTHVGFFIRTSAGPMYRNASSKKANMKVVDTPFLDYVKNTPGIVVLRVSERAV